MSRLPITLVSCPASQSKPEGGQGHPRRRKSAAAKEWMEQLTVYLGCAVAAAGLYLLLASPGAGRGRGRPARVLGAIIALGGFAFLLALLLKVGAGAAGDSETADRPDILFYVFAFIALGAAGRMITHPRPVYSALYFVLVVLASAAVFLLLEAEFMAFALVIVYAGAILITYLFVLMLAQQAPNPGEGAEGTAEYDRIPREPAAGVFVGFLMVALLGQAVFANLGPSPEQARTAAARDLDLDSAMEMEALVQEVNIMQGKRRALVQRFQQGDADLAIESRVSAVREGGVEFLSPPGERLRFISFDRAGLTREEFEGLLPQNIERVGLALVYKFPVSLELAGVILLMAMFGAVVLARKQIELGEDEKREAAGMRRISVEPAEAHIEAAPGTVRPLTRSPRPPEADSGGEP